MDMENDLEDFLRSRALSQDRIRLMKRDKIDKAVLAVMTDAQLARYIPTYGDRLATVSFCNRQQQTESSRESLLERVKEKIGDRKMTSKGHRMPSESHGMARKNNRNAEKQVRKIEIGWLHYSKPHYTQVRTRYGGGTRCTTVDKETTVKQLMEMAMQLFFPDGSSSKGPQDDFIFEMRDFKRNSIPLEETVGRMYDSTKLKLLRFYICSKEKFSDQSSVDEDSDCTTEDLEDQGTGNATADPGIASSSIPMERLADDETEPIISIDTASEHSGEDLSPSYSDMEADTVEWSSDFEAPSDDEITVRPHVIQNATADPGIASSSIPMERLADDETEPIISIDTASEHSGEDLSNATADPGIASSSIPMERLADDETEPIISIDTASEHSGEDLSPEQELNLPPPLPNNQSTEPGSSELPKAIRRASVHRIKILEDLVSVFKDSSVLDACLKMDFINEKAVDDAGVSREVYTAFWEQFLQQCEGETERVPRLRPDWDTEWQAIGRIWVKGLLDHGILPVMLSKAFILGAIHGIESVDTDTLMSSFLNYLPPVEKAAVQRAIEGTMEEGDEEDLLDLFSRMGSHYFPPKDNMRPALETMAHKALFQQPKFVLDSFRAVIAVVRANLPDQESVLRLYEAKKATGKRVAQLLETTHVVLAQREQTAFSFLQRYVKNADDTKAEKFLRFCTGSSVICVDKMYVSFNAESGLGRRPVAHTCGATLELPSTYSSFPQFRTEFDNILSSNYLVMDII